MFYDYADAVSAFINKKLIRLFAGLKTVLPIDEINLLGSVNAVYEEADKILRQKLLHIAKKTYRELGGEDTVDEIWLNKFLNTVNPTTGYIYVNEVDRKRSRCFESLIASSNKAKDVKTALRYFSAMATQYTIDVADAAAVEAYKSQGVKKVRWRSYTDHKVCKTCLERDRKIYNIDKIPSKHWNCRCWLEKVKE